jgi:hypothetical protein
MNNTKILKKISRLLTLKLCLLYSHSPDKIIAINCLKRLIKAGYIILLAAMLLQITGCATFLGGVKDDCQRNKAYTPNNHRQIRWGFVVADIIFWLPGLGFDFLDGKIYRHCANYKK